MKPYLITQYDISTTTYLLRIVQQQVLVLTAHYQAKYEEKHTSNGIKYKVVCISIWVIVLRSKFFFVMYKNFDFLSYDYEYILGIVFIFVNFILLEVFGILVFAN
jgi:hypothetical protein